MITETPAFDTTTVPNYNVMQQVIFSWYDYALFFGMLGLSILIGIYFGCFGSKQSTTNEYLLGSRKMKVIPITFSLVASHISGISLLAVPADVYRFGANYWWVCMSIIIVCVCTSYIFLPVFYNLGITSTYEYLERRFDNKTRTIASLLFALSMFLYLPIVIYIPALAFSAVTNINVHLITPLVCGVCIFYTTIGGLKAVVWTDTLQFTVTLGALAAVFTLGINSAGGFSNMWQKSIEGHRLDMFDFDWDPTKRETFWIMLFGFTFNWISLTCVNQGCIQKFIAVSSLKKAHCSVALYGFGMMLIKTVTVITGLVMFTKYAECDPISTGQVSRNDQLLPYYVLDVAGKIPGLPGLFIASIFSTALSTLSASLNCLAGTIYEDFVKHRLAATITQKTASNVLKCIVIIIGIVSTALVYIVERLGGILPLAIGFTSITGGPLVGLFTLGVLFPKANKKGAYYGSIIGLLFTSWIVFTAQYYKAKDLIGYPPKPFSVENCSFPVNVTITNTTFTPKTEDLPFIIFRISHYYYTLVGTLATILAGLLISLFTGGSDPLPNKDVLSAVIHFLLPKEEKESQITAKYYSVEKALHIVALNYDKHEEEKQS